MAAPSSWRVLAVVLVALLVAGLAAALVGDDAGPEPVDDGGDADASEEFLAAWERSRQATFRTVSDFVRTSNSTDAELTDRIVVVQRPPDRLSIDRDGVTGLVDGLRIACTFRTQEELNCQDAQAERTYDEDVARQLERLRAYVTGEVLVYETTREGECFVLELAEPIPAPPLGFRARFCFDADTDAPTLTTIERVEANDETRTLTITTEVDAADLDPERAIRGA